MSTVTYSDEHVIEIAQFDSARRYGASRFGHCCGQGESGHWNRFHDLCCQANEPEVRKGLFGGAGNCPIWWSGVARVGIPRASAQ